MQSALVPPGSETGVYYIPICNLPFDTTWRPLKEWLSRDCQIDYVQIFAVSTSGWIRVIGSYNFQRACDRLKDEIFNGRLIKYDDRNVTSPVLVKDVLDSNASPVSESSMHRQPAVAPMHYQDTSSHLYGATEGYGQWNMAPAPSYDVYEIEQQAWFQDDMASNEFSATANQYIPTEQRKVIIKHIANNASEEQIKTLIKQSLERVTSVKAELQRIDVPRGPGSQTRGHAFATFRTPEIAQGVTDVLNATQWHSRQLEARLIGETFTEQQAIRTSQSSSSRHKKSADTSKKKKQGEKARITASSGSASRQTGESSSRQARTQHSGGPVIADGTSHRPRSKSKERRRR
ncbi:hypothetical protein Cob_v008674 [Colletotrichum orbiculare MAFF 240422]|uniref:RRM domain-containing protein n=1 Tax=Colletotrichum orbiculare (strain 104-T / ATCC 96160 / CBS 514.97 / LARS 414 / MAFF 240422) TaxID=1213857 RepID=A0A484FJS2_COLOR|nr:hypothetical protein Cob_v008674 [Colletotrichum orbiculare MAFF 240422]